jgi:hypothetical protein
MRGIDDVATLDYHRGINLTNWGSSLCQGKAPFCKERCRGFLAALAGVVE